MADILIREATSADLASIVALQSALAAETEQVTLDTEHLHGGIAHVLQSPALGRYLVAVEPAGTIVGCLLCLTEWSTWRNAAVWWLHDVYVRPEWRQQKIFQQLYERVRGEAATTPRVLGLRLYVNRENAAARRIYERLGMRDDHWALYEWIPLPNASVKL